VQILPHLPLDARQAVVDIRLAPRDAQGRVHFTTDFVLLRPIDPTRANGRLLYDVNNRGNLTALAAFNSGRGGNLPTKVRAFPWRLSPRGRPGIALLWKNLVSLARVTPVRALLGLGAFLFGMVRLVLGLNEAGGPFGSEAVNSRRPRMRIDSN